MWSKFARAVHPWPPGYVAASATYGAARKVFYTYDAKVEVYDNRPEVRAFVKVPMLTSSKAAIVALGAVSGPLLWGVCLYNDVNRLEVWAQGLPPNIYDQEFTHGFHYLFA